MSLPLDKMQSFLLLLLPLAWSPDGALGPAGYPMYHVACLFPDPP
jgi:hypothetical protein